MFKFELRWAQLDLARQMENISFIEDFIKLLAESGYNGLLLYLEDRIRTKSYPYPQDNECYTPKDISHIIEFAQSYGIEIIPCVTTLGHGDRFFRHKELARLAELQGDLTDRFGGTKRNSFCISNPDFYNFMETYIREVASLFPSKWFHAGLDEFFDYNLCPRCKKLMPDFLSEQNGFLNHIIRMRNLLAKAGKTMLMWSDMFEFYPDIFEQVPADVVMVDWQYQVDVRNYQGHLLDVAKENRLALNNK